MPYVRMTFVHATLVLVTFVHISNIWPNFNQTFWTQFLDHHFVRPKLLGSKIIWTQNHLGPRILLGSYIFRPKLFWIQNFILTQFFYPKFWTKMIFDSKFFGPKTFWTHNFLDTKFLWTQTPFSSAFWVQNRCWVQK